MNTLHLAWMIGRPSAARSTPQILTVSAYAMVSAVLLIVLGGAYSFTSFEPEAQGMYLPLAAFALVLLIVPLVVLGAAAARLSARTQDRALSSLRLLGSTGTQISQIAMIQAAGTALVGALLGVVLYLAASPLVSMIQFQGAPIGSAIYLPWWVIALAVVLVVLLSVISAVAGLRKLVITPLAVATRQSVPVPSWARALITVGVIAVLYFVLNNLAVIAQDLATMIGIIVGGFGMGLLVLNLVGPWLVARVGKSKLAKAQKPEELLAARMILENPAQSWRQVSGVAMASFVAVVGGSGAALMGMGGGEVSEPGWMQYLSADVLTGVLLTLAIAFICVAASAAITQSASTLDRAELYDGLHRLGMSYKVMNAARTKSLMIPALTASIGFAIASAVLVLPLAGIAVLVKPVTVLVVILAVVLGLLLVRVSITVANPQRLLVARS
ncbi:FtsX-like permease family protein [Glutamicibacter sp.]|uniref:FtsX-like permease family protein n=1 Tax=Glutamicibacter sp. TaxID=1931995 RepID=UPI0028BE1810|nr:FtsX-like permease family protein [Glutamicibacter sp.]